MFPIADARKTTTGKTGEVITVVPQTVGETANEARTSEDTHEGLSL